MVNYEKKRLIVVLGMHRSGTSAITRGLKVMGVELGDTLMPAIEGINDKGFWEDLDLFTLNNELLSMVESDWHYLAPIEPADVEILRKNGSFDKAAALLHRKLDKKTIFGFKDPRVAKLFRFWKEVFIHCQLDTSCVLAVRHPLSIVKSLNKRDGFDPEKSYFLWLGHVIESLAGSTGLRRVLVDYDDLLQSPEVEINRVARELDLEIDEAELQSYRSQFLDKTLRHTIYELKDLSVDDTCPPLVREIYASLRDVACDNISLDDPMLQNQIARWMDEFRRLKAILSLADRLFVENAGSARAMAEEISNLNQALGERDAQITFLSQAVAERDLIVNEMRDSTSWRITHSLRVIARALRYTHIK
jgi:hypothetical protein